MNRPLLNPFYWFSIIWTIVYILFFIPVSGLFTDGMATPLIIIMPILIIVSFLLGFFLRNSFKLKKLEPSTYIDGIILIITAIFILAVAANFIYAKEVPFIKMIVEDGYDTKTFTPIPTFYVFTLTFGTFYFAYLSYLFAYTKNIRSRLIYVANLVLVFLFFLLVMNRGAMMMSAFIFIIIFLSSIKIRWYHVILLLVILFGGMYLFGCLGNTRQGYAWNDNTYVTEVFKINFFPDWCAQFGWSYMYLVSPFANFNHLVLTYTSTYDFAYTILNVLPDALTKRLWPDFTSTLTYIQENCFIIKTIPGVQANFLTVASVFGYAYCFLGVYGIIFMFLVIAIMILVILLLTKKSYRGISLSLLSMVVTFTFFENTISYSGISFCLIYPVLASLWSLISTLFRKKR